MAAPNPTFSLILFLILTLFYSIIKYYTKSEKMILIWTSVYFLVNIISQFFINLGVINEICGKADYYLAFKTTIIPQFLVFAIVFLILITFPGWLIPFSNTIGYLFTYLTGVNGFLKSILKENINNENTNEADLVKALNNVYLDKSLLINSITMQNVEQWWQSMSQGGLFKPDVQDSDKDTLKQYIKLKTEVSEFIWLAFTGVYTTSVSYNAIVNSECTQSLEEMEKRHQEYLEKEKKITNDKNKESKNKIIYKTYD